jgi:glutamine amidotransferase
MCRHLGYLGGRAVALGDLVLAPPHSLLVQSYAPRELLRGCVCADGAGVGWYADGDPEPATYRRECPIWADPDLAGVARVVRSRCVLAAVRNGTPGVPGGLPSVQPFRNGAYLFSHNGAVAGFAERARGLRDLLPDDLHASLTGASDSETLFLLTLARVREAGGDLAAGLRAALAEVAERAPGSSLNVLLTDGRRLVASRAAAGGPADSLHLLVDGARFPGGTVVASEPLDGDPRWEPVPEGRILVVEGDREPTLEPVG